MFKILFIITISFPSWAVDTDPKKILTPENMTKIEKSCMQCLEKLAIDQDNLFEKLLKNQEWIEKNEISYPMTDDAAKNMDQRSDLLLQWSLLNISKKARNLIFGCQKWEMEKKFGDQAKNWIPVDNISLTCQKEFKNKNYQNISLKEFLEIHKGGIIANFNNKEHLELILKHFGENSIESIFVDNHVFYFTEWHIEIMEIFKKILKEEGTFNYPIQLRPSSISPIAAKFDNNDWALIGIEIKEENEESTKKFKEFMKGYIDGTNQEKKQSYQILYDRLIQTMSYLNFNISLGKDLDKNNFFNWIKKIMLESFYEYHNETNPNKLFMGNRDYFACKDIEKALNQHQNLWEQVFGEKSVSYQKNGILPYKYFHNYNYENDQAKSSIENLMTITKK